MVNPPNSSETVSSPPPPPSTPPTFVSPPSSKGSNKTWIYVTIGVIGGGVLIVGVCVLFFLRRVRRRKESTNQGVFSKSFEAGEKPDNRKLDEESQDFLENISSMAQSIKVYSFIELQQATDNFSSDCLIKGSVYCGKIKGDLAAIKKVNGDVSREVEILNKVNHFNVLKLSGICFNDGNWYFVYEYAVNGSLDEWIFKGNGEGGSLTWNQRVQILLDVATGLNYLHYFTTPPLVHKDIRSSNVLLDGEMRAKIASLGLARSTEAEEGEFALTRHIVGTKGYMAPEYLENGLISVKLDVYAFGVLLLETISGKEAVNICGGENRQLADVVNSLTSDDGQDNLLHFIDPSIREDCPLDLVLFITKMSGSCLDKNPTARPSMEEIIQSLSKVMATSQA
ncbi:hypothetical protein MLD38_004638 [Melastoma candidum]|nr:hypothetical protein MLD38_004638 [Melastoma candidum]